MLKSGKDCETRRRLNRILSFADFGDSATLGDFTDGSGEGNLVEELESGRRWELGRTRTGLGNGEDWAGFWGWDEFWGDFGGGELTTTFGAAFEMGTELERAPVEFLRGRILIGLAG